MTAINGAGIVYVYDTQSDFDEDNFNYKSINVASEGSYALENFPSLYSLKYRNLRVKDKQYIVVDSGLLINIKRTK